MTKKRKIIFLIVAFLVIFKVGNVGSIEAANFFEINNLIVELKLVLINLTGQLEKIEEPSEVAEPEVIKTDTWCHDFNTNLRYGFWGEEVFALQTALEKEGLDLGPDKDLKYFKTYTQEAVSAFQEKYRKDILDSKGLKSSTGFVGESTRVKLNEIYGCTVKETVKEDVIKTEIEKEDVIEIEIETESEKEISIQENIKTEESEIKNSKAFACFDSDGGKDYYVKGYAETNGGEDKKEDSCRYFYTKTQSVDMLYEAYCQDGEIKVDEYQCPQGCRSSACVEDRQSDIVFSALSLSPEEPVTAEKATFNFTLENLGNLKTPDKLTISYSLSREDESLFFKGKLNISYSIGPKEKKDFSLEVPEAFDVEGNYNAVLLIDPENQIYESAEDNNQVSEEFFVAKKQVCFDSDGGKAQYSTGYTTMDEGKTKNSDSCIYDKVSRGYKVAEGYCQNNIPETVSLSCSQGCLFGACAEKQQVAYWSFNEEGNLAKDESGNGLDGIISGAKKITGISGKGLSFQGSGHLRIKDNDLFDLNSGGTIAVWVKYSADGKGGSILSKCENSNSFGGCNYVLKLENLNFSSVGFWMGSGSSGLADSARLPSATMETDVWYRLVSVFDGFYIKIYINGELKKTSLKTLNSPLVVNDSDLLIGAMNCGFSGICNYFTGDIDEVKIYNYALSEKEIKEDYERYR
ncbi:MAG: LamG-like jellyroll fold domain-containing protein [Candidatus Nealsonbacteria bacterium]